MRKQRSRVLLGEALKPPGFKIVRFLPDAHENKMLLLRVFVFVVNYMTKSEPILSGTNPPRRRSLTLAAKQNSLFLLEEKISGALQKF